jgi:uncharacterized protein YpuA (DUF1002 family)
MIYEYTLSESESLAINYFKQKIDKANATIEQLKDELKRAEQSLNGCVMMVAAQQGATLSDDLQIRFDLETMVLSLQYESRE